MDKQDIERAKRHCHFTRSLSICAGMTVSITTAIRLQSQDEQPRTQRPSGKGIPSHRYASSMHPFRNISIHDAQNVNVITSRHLARPRGHSVPVSVSVSVAAAAAVRSHFRVLLAGDVHSLQDQLDTLPRDSRNSLVEIQEVARAVEVGEHSPVVDTALAVGTEHDSVEGSDNRRFVRVEERPGFDRGTPWGCRDRSLVVHRQKVRNLAPTHADEPPVIGSTVSNLDRKSW